MATYLLAWNDARYSWDNLLDDIDEIAAVGYLDGDWSCGNTKRIAQGDRVFLIKLGREEGVEKEARNTDPSPWPPSHGSGLPREGGIDQ
jgi:hypothetical protein